MRVNIFSFSSFSFSPVSGRMNVMVAYLATFPCEEDLSAQCHNRTLLKENSGKFLFISLLWELSFTRSFVLTIFDIYTSCG